MSLSSGDLTTLSTAKSYLDSAPSDIVLTGLITRISRMILATLNRPLLIPKTYIEQRDGTGTEQLVLSQWPLISLNEIKISGQVLKLAPQLSDQGVFSDSYGYRFQPWNGVPPGDPTVVELTGGAWFRRGRQNVVTTYKAGYEVSGETQVIGGTPYQITPQTPFGAWATDEGVTFSDTGQTLVPVPVASVPTTGQYIPPDPTLPTPRMYYTFSSADTTRSVILNYGFIPGDLEQVVLEVLSERTAYRKRVGIHSQSLAGQEVVTFDNSGLSKWVVDAICPYLNVLPPPMGALV